MNDLARQRLQHRTSAFDGAVLTSDHERQRARGGTLDATGHRGVELRGLGEAVTLPNSGSARPRAHPLYWAAFVLAGDWR